MARFKVTELTEVSRDIVVEAKDARSSINKVERDLHGMVVTHEIRKRHYVSEEINEENFEPLVEEENTDE